MNEPSETFPAWAGRIAEVDGDSIAAIIAAAADVALVVDAQGTVRDVAFKQDDGSGPGCEWLGRMWADTVTVETRAGVDQMLVEARVRGASRPRQVSHPRDEGPDLAVAYTAVRLGHGGDVAALGRDLGALVRLEQRLVEVQQTLERDHCRVRDIETRYRVLFQLSTEAVLIVDALTMKVVEANPAAAQLFDAPARAMAGKPFPCGLDAVGQRAALEHLTAVATTGHAEPIYVSLAADGRPALLAAALVRQDGGRLLVVRFLTERSQAAATSPSATARVVELIQAAPDAFVVADIEGRVLSANHAFLDLAQLATQEQARGRSLGDWIGRPGADLNALLATLREHAVARLFATTMRGEYGSSGEIELSAVAVSEGEERCIGIVARDVGRRVGAAPQCARDLTRAVEQLTALVGRVSLRELVGDTTDLIERHLIEAALALTHDNRTAAAHVLGLSRQSLYVKLRRHNLGGGQPARSLLSGRGA